MSAIPGHVHISEREPDGSWEDCTFDSGLEFYRDAIDSTRPATHAEAQAIRAASGKGPTGGADLDDFRKGVAARYHKTLPASISNKAILTYLTPGMCATVQGSMSAFGPTDPLSKWDRNFDGGHAVYVANVDGTLLWCDPEAPTTAAVPVAITRSQLQKFVNAFAGRAIVAPIKALQKETNVFNLITALPGYTAAVKPQSNIRADSRIAATKFRTVGATAEPVTLVGTVSGDKDPSNNSTVWYVWWKNGRWEFTAQDNIVNVARPSGGLTQADVDKAVAASNEAAKLALNAAVGKAMQDATTAEKARVRGILGL